MELNERKIANAGIHTYYPVVGQKKPIVEIEAYRALFAGEYILNTPLDLEGEGIIREEKLVLTDEAHRPHWKQYRVSEEAFQWLSKHYAVLLESIFD